MEKRQIPFPPNTAKKIKLDIPGGSSTSTADVFDDNTWDNDKIDEMMLMASQACEVVENGELYEQDDMSLDKCMNDFITTDTDHKTTSVTSSMTGPSHLMHELQTAMVKLDRMKYENTMLQDKFSSKEGEVAILRTQLRSAQSQINAEKIQKLKTEERKSAEFNEKINCAEKELRDLKTKMEFQDLEVTKLREKCRMLEKGSKIKLTQPSTPLPKPKWPSFSQKMDASVINESHVKNIPADVTAPRKTDIFQPYKLNLDVKEEYPMRDSIPESIFHHQPIKSIPLEYKSNREPLFVEHSSFIDIRRRILEEFKSNKSSGDDNSLSLKRLPRESGDGKVGRKFETIFQDLSALVKMTQEELGNRKAVDCALRICEIGKENLVAEQERLHILSRKVNPQTVMEMNEVYLTCMTNNPDPMVTNNLFDDSSWCENEQAIDARRIVAVIAKMCLCISSIAEYVCGLHIPLHSNQSHGSTQKNDNSILELSLDICKKIEHTGCSQRYPGLLSALVLLIEHSISKIENLDRINTKIFEFCKCLLLLRPNGRCVIEVFKILIRFHCNKHFLSGLCRNSENSSNVVVDYSQGVTLYSTESCVIQFLCNQVEVWSCSLSKERNTGYSLSEMTMCLLNLCHLGMQYDMTWAQFIPENKCLCYIHLYQCLTVCLHQLAKYYTTYQQIYPDGIQKDLIHILCSGLVILKSSLVRDPDMIWRLKEYEGHYQLFIQIMCQISNSKEIDQCYSDVLKELKSTLALPMDAQKPDPMASQIWENIFNTFLITD